MGLGDLAKHEKILKGEAVSDDALNIEQLTEELIKIGKNDGFITTEPKKKFDDQLRNIRAHEIGEKLYQRGGLELMLKVFRKTAQQVGDEQSSFLRFAWQGIGGKWDPHYVTTLL